MSEAIAETDEALMEKFFEGEAFTTEEIVQGMAVRRCRSGQITARVLRLWPINARGAG